jgi:hypothetical protein
MQIGAVTRRIGPAAAALVALGALVASGAACARGTPESYRSAVIDRRGDLHLIRATGADVVRPKRAGQVSFEQPRISGDGRTAGWLETYPDPAAAASTPLADVLVIYRAGRIVRIISTPQIFWSWRFAGGDRNVVACTGPTHRGPVSCATHRIATGAVLAGSADAIGRS